MKPFDSLTRLGAARRLQPLVENASRHYDLRVERVRPLSTAWATATPPQSAEAETCFLASQSQLRRVLPGYVLQASRSSLSVPRRGRRVHGSWQS